MTNKTSLSDKRKLEYLTFLYKEEDVKEFIKELKEEFSTLTDGDLVERIWNKIDKLAGEKLI